MKHFILFIIFFVFGLNASADLLDRIKLEDSLRSRVQDVVHSLDPKARIMMEVQYKSYKGTLPGTGFDDSLSSSPSRIELNDIAKATVEIYTQDDALQAQLKDLIFRVLPIEKKYVSISFKDVDPSEKDKMVTVAHLSPDSLASIAHETVTSFTKVLIYLGGSLLTCFALLCFFLNQKMVQELKNQLGGLTRVVGESSFGSAPQTPQQNNSQYQAAAAQSVETHRGSLDKIPTASLVEIFADCYWCELDSYASWLWRQLPNEKRAQLLQSFEYAREYSFYFLNVRAEEHNYHDHPYYLEPVALSKVSQSDLAKEVKKNLGFWHSVSPLRQTYLPLSLQDKLSAVQAKPVKLSQVATSAPRVLVAKPTWGEISLHDEEAIFKNPKMVPAPLRASVKSLVWLAQRDEFTIKNILAKYDAKSLAQAWVGPVEILKKLEAHLPEKNLRLLENYRSKVSPSRSSQVFENLVEESFAVEGEKKAA